MASLNDIYAELKGIERSIINKGGEIIKANSSPSLSELRRGIDSINTEAKIKYFTSNSPKHIITAELPGLTLNLRNSEGEIVDTKPSGGMVELNTNSIGIHTVEAINDAGEKIWDNEVEIIEDGTYYVKSGKKLNDYTWDEIKQAADGKYAKYMWSIGDTKVIHKWLGVDFTQIETLYPETYNDKSSDTSLHQVMIFAWGGDNKADGSGTTGITFVIFADRTTAGDNTWLTYYNAQQDGTFTTNAAETSSSNYAAVCNTKALTYSLIKTNYPSELVTDWPTISTIGSTTDIANNNSSIRFLQWPCNPYRYLVAPKGDYFYNFKDVTSSTSGTYYVYDPESQDFIAKSLPTEYDANLFPYYERITKVTDGPILYGLDDELKEVISKVKKVSYIGYRYNTNLSKTPPLIETEDYLWWPSFTEVYGDEFPLLHESYNYPSGLGNNYTLDHLRIGEYIKPLDFNSSDFKSDKKYWVDIKYYRNCYYENHASYGKDSTYKEKETNSSYGYLYKTSSSLLSKVSRLNGITSTNYLTANQITRDFWNLSTYYITNQSGNYIVQYPSYNYLKCTDGEPESVLYPYSNARRGGTNTGLSFSLSERNVAYAKRTSGRDQEFWTNGNYSGESYHYPWYGNNSSSMNWNLRILSLSQEIFASASAGYQQRSTYWATTNQSTGVLYYFFSI